MNRALAALLLLCTLTSCATAPQRTVAVVLPTDARDSPQRYVVVTVRNDTGGGTTRAGSTARGYDLAPTYGVSSAALKAAHAIESDYGLTETSSWPIAVLGVHCIVYRLATDADREQVLEALAHDRRVESAEPLARFAVQTTRYNDAYAGLQLNLNEMSVGRAHELSLGQGVRLAVIDTGVDTSHPDLQGRTVVARNFVDDDEGAFRNDRHGTAVAGLIAATPNNRIGIAGVAPAVKLLVYKACWQDQDGRGGASCNSFTLAQALAAAIGDRADVVNLSLAGPADPLLSRLVHRGTDDGMVFVGAVAPSAQPNGFPTGIDGVIAVDAGELHSPGGPACLSAPGHEILTLVPGAHYDFQSGSSLATAAVSGVVALLRSQKRHLNSGELQHLLRRTSRSVTRPDGRIVTIDACDALSTLLNRGPCTPSTVASDQ